MLCALMLHMLRALILFIQTLALYKSYTYLLTYMLHQIRSNQIMTASNLFPFGLWCQPDLLLCLCSSISWLPQCCLGRFTAFDFSTIAEFSKQ